MVCHRGWWGQGVGLIFLECIVSLTAITGGNFEGGLSCVRNMRWGGGLDVIDRFVLGVTLRALSCLMGKGSHRFLGYLAPPINHLHIMVKNTDWVQTHLLPMLPAESVSSLVK